MSQSVSQFINNTSMKGEVRDYILKVFDQKVLDNTYAGNDVSGMKEARDTLLYAFSQMASEFNPGQPNGPDPDPAE